MQIPITVNCSIDPDKLFNTLLKSQYMQKRGYTILYSNNDGQGNYGLCYNHDNDLIYIHVRVLTTHAPNTFSYFVALGEKQHKNQIESDLKSLVSEIETNP